MMAVQARRRFIDIGANITDSMFRGVYHNSQKHLDDFESMLERARQVGLRRIIITGGSLEDSRRALQLASTAEDLFSTVGCHPTRCSEFDKHPQGADHYLNELVTLAQSSDKVAAIGEFGLDYDRTQFCPADVQRKYFERQFQLVESVRKPLFLHCRNAADDLVRIVAANRDRFTTGVVHSFDGTWQQASKLLDMNLYIGINGCSLKTADNLEVVKKIPSDRLMLETDCPYCEVKPTHAGYHFVRTKFEAKKKEKFEPGTQVKGRNEPQNIVQVLEVVAGCRNEDADQLAEVIFENTEKVFFR